MPFAGYAIVGARAATSVALSNMLLASGGTEPSLRVPLTYTVSPVSPLLVPSVAITRVGPAPLPVIVSDAPLQLPNTGFASWNETLLVTSLLSPSSSTSVAVYGCVTGAP